MNRFRRGAIFGSTLLLTLGLSEAVRAGTVQARPAAATKAVKVVEIGDQYAFKAQKVTISVGTKVSWTNTTDAPHTVTTTGQPPKMFDKQLAVDGKISITFKKAGTYHYFCAIHPYMKGKIVVK